MVRGMRGCGGDLAGLGRAGGIDCDQLEISVGLRGGAGKGKTGL